MAKSFFEPKKIVRYANNQQVIEGGLGSAPAPRRAASATRPVPKTQAIPPAAQNVSAPAPLAPPMVPIEPAPPPAPPTVGETRAFLFDGATKLTSSFSGGNFGTLSVGFTITPYWGQAATGSWTVLSIGIPDDPNAAISNVYISRTSGSGGYTDKLTTELVSGSIYYRSSQILTGLSPNFYSGSGTSDNVYLRTYISAGDLTNTRYTKNNGSVTQISNGITVKESNTTGSYGTNGRYLFYIREVNSRREDYRFVVGAPASGSVNYFSGSIGNLYVSRIKQLPGPTMPYSFIGSDATYITRHYRFEGNTSPQKGVMLYVDGTETYVSSSI